MSNFVNLLDIVYPVGSIYQSMDATSPVDFIGGTWTQIKTFLYGADTAQETGGEATHTLTVDEIPSHFHSVSINIQHGDGPVTSGESLTSGLQVGGRRRYGDTTTGDDCGGGTQQLASLYDLFYLVSHSIAALKASGLNLSEVAYV